MRGKTNRTGAKSQELDDNQLFDGIERQEQDCLSMLYDRYGSSAFGLALKICGNRTIAEDVVQEAFMAVWQRPGGFDSRRGSVASFLMGVVHHKAVDAIRREESVRRREENFATEAADPAPDAVVEAAFLTIRRHKVRQALKQLSGVQREALELAYLKGLTYSEVADRLGIPLGTAKTRLRDGLISLRSMMDQAEVMDR